MKKSSPFVITAEASIHGVNTTPLIDVLLVLLIIFIISLPAATHEVAIDLPSGPPGDFRPVVHRLHLGSGGGLSWDGRPIGEASLSERLASVRSDANAMLELSASGDARYEDYDRILAAVKRANITRLGLVGNQGFARDLD